MDDKNQGKGGGGGGPLQGVSDRKTEGGEECLISVKRFLSPALLLHMNAL
jgi:hypothetical protein